MSIFGNSGPLERSVVITTATVNSLKKQLPIFHPGSKRHELASRAIKAGEKFKLQLEEEYIKLKSKDSPPLLNQEVPKADVLSSVN